MLYEKNKEKALSKELFKNPTSEYRGAPFWSWNCELDSEELLRQIEILKQMGFGGYHMHVRTGMATEYLSDDFLNYIKLCVEKGKKEGMLSYLYDEDRWPSGSAGGMVTKNKDYRQSFILITTTPYPSDRNTNENCALPHQPWRSDNGRLIACFDIELDNEGYLKSYKLIGRNDAARFDKWYVYLETACESPWYNNQAYVDTLNKKAMDEFINITYNSYKRAIGDDFGKDVISIFTDEPQVFHKGQLPYSFDKVDVYLPWTADFPDTYKAQYNQDILECIPELFWDLKDGPSTVRYHYHDHLCERFVNAFSDNCGAWCKENGLALTGHMMMEDGLFGQTVALGEVMRCYRGFDIPGIDMLCAARHFLTAKQAQSAVHQYGREGMMSELYGVTGWDFDFRGHKLHGDWQVALGVTLRVQHLAWVSMKGEAKRDYPASISYQSSWHTEYKNIEDHFARVNTALTRGKPCVKVGVIHPIESYWLYWGPNDKTYRTREELEANFKNLNDWLVTNLIDFDYISESLLPELNDKGSVPFKVGKMEYDILIVPGCHTLRSTTLKRLEEYKAAGGNLIFLGNPPKYENAIPGTRGEKLYSKSRTVQFTKQNILDALRPFRTVEVLRSNGQQTERYCHQIRDDDDSKWLFLAQAADPYNKDIANLEEIDIYLCGEYSAELYDTLTGQIIPLKCEYKNNQTKIRAKVYDYDSLLIKYSPNQEAEISVDAQQKQYCEINLPDEFDYTLSEPNVLLLDIAATKLDDGEYSDPDEILRADNMLRTKLGIPIRMEIVAQPWAIGKEQITHTATLKFKVMSEIAVDNVKLALEDAELAKIVLNSKQITNKPKGFYVDKCIGVINIGSLNKGENVIEVTLPFGESTNLEYCYILGDFGVKVIGKSAVICEAPKKLRFGNLCDQGFAFYGGNVTYKIPVKTDGEDIKLHIPHYRGGLITVENNGQKAPIIYPPYDAVLSTKKGENTVDVTLYGNRHNCFGCIHNADTKQTWINPNAWRTSGDSWCYEYILKPMGILSTPIIEKEI